MIKVSIITVCYNSAVTLEKTILSVAGQSYKNIEYILVDGNSNDGTLDILKKQELKISKWISEPDSGLYDAMNKGILMATGDLIGILNSDDTFNSDKVVEEVVAFHSKNSIDASIGNVIQHKKSGRVVRIYSSENWTPERLKSGFMPPHPSIFFRRELFYNYGNYNLGFKIGADYELIIRFFLCNNITWGYNDVVTTSMLVGGLSSSGLSSYRLITSEICKALTMNDIKFSPFRIKMRIFWKILEIFHRN